MAARVTADNPTGVDTFDHSDIAHLPEYAAASRALDALGHAIGRAEIDLGQQRWLEVVGEMAAALPYADACSECTGPVPTPAPHAAAVNDEWLNGQYRCPSCAATWTCGYAANPHLSDD
ncbi:hypothetical protein [Pseudonocardia nigra]|uniref:hypothetical protein n=1 Tax=Pseudonocardia nigra TaxID=1921578 RepID=UPI001C600164|nr:hypothetical protein [Pseudonocardia nigra]